MTAGRSLGCGRDLAIDLRRLALFAVDRQQPGDRDAEKLLVLLQEWKDQLPVGVDLDAFGDLGVMAATTSPRSAQAGG